MKAVPLDFGSGRSTLLLRPLSVLDQFKDRLADLDVLTIGPRTEGEILNLIGHGFSKDRIKALDVFSYSPWIDCGDMHDMPYDDSSFDVVVHSYVLLYSNDMEKALSELVRVTRTGGCIAIAFSFLPETDEELEQRLGYLPGSKRRVESIDELLSLFPSGAIRAVHWSQDVYDQTKICNIALIASV